ncbi:hypothetical protein HBA55_34450 [Pseudomaricurvus alkylphenolicus]|uniref:hypothetical protein n=1 Tax=Pseudomaricurvus alkylphenolicus TaxID=1306991 RepID=UPI00141D8FD1|nr:hypothetical protein [Pseudomaricurvus alkylphenolicus]NIB44732.1 hypothetical protein [Pseudomaricurvus alkylphenolicus]
MSIVDWINPFNKVADIVSEVVEDKDARNRLNHELESLKQQVYIVELNTKTVPWIDAVHKMGRQLISVTSLIAGVVLVYVNPEVDPLTLGAILGPGGIYNAVKGKGK